jgi:uncharacterized protein
MMQPRSLIDSSFLYALYAEHDPNHAESVSLSELLSSSLVILDVTLVEVTFLFRRKAGLAAVTHFLRSIHRANLDLDVINRDDLLRAAEIIDAYSKSDLDFVDACLAAYAERKNIDRICTYDYRDFSILKPSHTKSFILLPLQYDQL